MNSTRSAVSGTAAGSVHGLQHSGAPAPVATSPRDSALDGLRGIAIALVLWHHLFAGFLPASRDSWLGWLKAGTGLAWCGVDLFFVLSGFFIGGILIDRRDSPRLARIFYLRRAVRILPLYYVTLGVTFLLTAAGAAQAYHLFPAWVYGLFLTNFALAIAQHWDWLPLSVLWSLAIEEQFYLAAPWLVRALSTAHLPWFLVGLVVLAAVARTGMIIAFPHGHLAAHVLMPLRMDALALGALVAWAVRNEGTRPIFNRLAQTWRWFLAGGLIATAGLAMLRPAEGSPLLCLFGYTLLAVLFAMVVAIVAGVRPAGFNTMLASRPLAHLGRHSYFVYLWHGLIGVAVIRALGGENFILKSPAALGTVVAGVAAVWVAAAISWKFFEGPLVAWGHRESYETVNSR